MQDKCDIAPLEYTPPIDTHAECFNNAKSYLCGVCSAGILHVKVAFRFIVPAAAAKARLNGPDPKPTWLWEVCVDCMQIIREIASESDALQGYMPKRVSLLALNGPSKLTTMLATYCRSQSY